MRVEYHNGTGLLAVIGDPIAHSLSPLLQNSMIEALGQEDLYLAVQVEKGNLPAFLTGAKAFGLQGFNLTMPHKEDILPFLADMTPEARRCGSVNTVRLRDGYFEGHSTDGIGFRRAIADFGLTFEHQVITILGAGGAAKAIALTAVDSGAREVRVLNRTVSRAEALCQGEARMRAFSLDAAEQALTDTDLLINTTPVGMEGVSGAAAFPYLATLQAGAAAVDCIYAPAMTPFMAAAKALGHPVANGIGMLVYQAIYAYEFFKGLTFDGETVARLGQLLLEKSGVDPRGEDSQGPHSGPRA